MYVIGDVHGRRDLLTQIHARIDADKAAHRPGHPVEIYLGDYIDRGPDSAGVISQLVSRSREVDAVFLRGNHEQLLLDFLDGEIDFDLWAGVGATATLLSYGVDPAILRRHVGSDVIRGILQDSLPADHLVFLRGTELYARLGPYVLVHGGV